MEKSEAEVKQFLARFLPKLRTWGIIYLNREKNLAALTELAITASQRDAEYLWVFGKEVNGKEVYIKVAVGAPSSQTICISFHLAEYPLKYVFK